MQSEKIESLTKRICQKILGGRVVSVQLSDRHNPHYAKILLRNFRCERIAAVLELQNGPPEKFLTSALLWFHRLENLKTRAAGKLWLISSQAPRLARLCTALRGEWQQKISNFNGQLDEFFDEPAELKKNRLARPPKISGREQEIISLMPDEIQVQGTQLTFKGLAFIKFKGRQIWLGVEDQDRTWNASNGRELNLLLEKLRLYRQCDSPNRQHAFYKMNPEAWLESCLRNDITALDKNLILSPVHQQFRAGTEQIDLLALRRDGRLVIIELKVTPNREHLFQAVDYWQEIEKQRIAGNLQGLFGPLPIADAPSLIYLVAPHSAFHPDFWFLAATVSPELEIYRFDLHEDWRRKIKILEKQKIRAS